MQSFTAGHISSPEAAELVKTAQEKLGDDRWQFYPGVSYRNLLLYRGSGRHAPFSPDTRTTPPHDLTDKSVIDDYPRGPGSDILTHLMTESEELFADHPVNMARRAAGKPPATNVWLWGLGSTPSLTPFAQLYGVQGAMITAVDLLRGLASLIGWKRIEVPGPPAISTPTTPPRADTQSMPLKTSIWSACTSKPRTRPRTRVTRPQR